MTRVERPIPHDNDAERAVLAACLLRESAVDEVSAVVRPTSFYSDRHRTIFEALLRLRERRVPPDLMSLKRELQDGGHLAGVGGPAYLASILADAVPSANVGHHARAVERAAWRRNIVTCATSLAAAASNGETDSQLDELRRALAEDCTRPLQAQPAVALSSVVATVPEYDADPFVRRRGLHMWYGPPGNYKTYAALLLALEMTQREAGEQLLGVEGCTISRPWKSVVWLGDEENAGELRARAEIIARGHGLRAPEGDEILFADASGGDTMLDIRHVPQLVAQSRPDAVFVDPMANLVPSEDEQGRPIQADLDNAYALRRVCRPLRRLCKQNDLAVFLMHHPNASGTRERGPTAYKGSVDALLRVALDESGNLVLDFEKNRDASKVKVHLEPVWSGHRHGPEPLTLQLAETRPPASEERLPPNSAKILAAVRAAGPISKNDAMDAVPGVHRTTRSRNFNVLVTRGLIEADPMGRYIAVEPALPGVRGVQ